MKGIAELTYMYQILYIRFMSEGRTPEQPKGISQTGVSSLRPGERILPDGSKVRDVHFMIEEDTERRIAKEIEEAGKEGRPMRATGIPPIHARPTFLSEKHTKGFNTWQIQNIRERGSLIGTPKPPIRVKAPRPPESPVKK